MCVGHGKPTDLSSICHRCPLRLANDLVNPLVCVSHSATQTKLCCHAETETARDDAVTQAAKLRGGMDVASAEMAALRGLLNPEP